MQIVPAVRPEYPARIADRIERAIAAPLFRVSPRTKLRLSGGKPIQLDGNTLHPDLQLMLRLRALAAGGDHGITTTTPAQARKLNRRESLLYQGPAIEVGKVNDIVFDAAGTKLKARHYAPDSSTPKPLLVFFHGGGFVFGDLDTHDAPCRYVCKHAGVHVLSVDYRLAPEAAFPTAADDALEGFRFAVQHAAELGAVPSRIGVAGDSAGGNLSAVVSQLTRDNGERAPDFAVLIYPAVDRKTPYPSKELFANGFLLTKGDMDYFDVQYFGGGDEVRSNPKLSPFFNPRFEGLCPSVVITAGFDPLRDEGEAYARKLEAAGNTVTLRRESALTHGFFNMSGVSPACAAAVARISDDVRRLAHA